MRNALHRIANAAKDIHGHYRIFVYSKGDICDDARFLGPPSLEVERDVRREGCNGNVSKRIAIEQTVPLVCSSFVWHATNEANRLGGKKIVLDTRPSGRRRTPPGTERCNHDNLIQIRPTPDDSRVYAPLPGMYRYTESERLNAGRWLHDEFLVPKVRKTIDDAIPDYITTIGGSVAVGMFVIRTLLSSNPIGLALTVIAELLGITITQLSRLIALTTDMPDDVANQVCNTFAFDNAEEVDDPVWEHPGAGYSVSPDDILHEWSPVQGVSAHDEIIGVYGYNEAAQLAPPTYDQKPPPPSSWQISQGLCDVFHGAVFLRKRDSTLVPAHAAQVRIGSQLWYTDSAGQFNGFGAVQGRYWTVATYKDPSSGLTLQSEGRAVVMGPGGMIPPSAAQYIIDLPPQTRRKVTIAGKMYLVNRAIVGSDWIGEPRFVVAPSPINLDLKTYGFPDEPKFKSTRDAYLERKLYHGEGVDDWGVCQLEFVCRPNADQTSVDVEYRSRLISHDELEDLAGDPSEETFWTAWHSVVIPETAQNSIVGVKLAQISLLRKPVNPVRAYIDIEIRNQEAV